MYVNNYVSLYAYIRIIRMLGSECVWKWYMFVDDCVPLYACVRIVHV